MHAQITHSSSSSSFWARTEAELIETCEEDIRIARAEVEDLSGLVSEKDDQLCEAQLAYDELEDDMNDVEERMREQTEVILGLGTKLADATETVHATVRLRKQEHDLEIDVATLREQLLLASEGVRIADKEQENGRAAAKVQTERHDDAMNRLSIRYDRLQGELGSKSSVGVGASIVQMPRVGGAG